MLQSTSLGNITLSDVGVFRTLFGLKKNDPTITVVGTDPGLNGDDDEAYLDAEWAGVMAPGASVNFLVSSASLVGQGIDTAGLYAVENNIGDIILLSYGGCEGSNGAAGTAFWNTLWEEAAAQGQTVFVSSGDSSAAGCDNSSNSYATGGYGVNALGSSAYNVAVGGSMFVDYGDTQFWGSASGIPYASALSYDSGVAEGAGGAFLTSTAPAVVPTGTVGFYSGSTLLGSAPLVYQPSASTYNATFTTQLFPVGMDSISAVYAGDANYKGVTSSTYTLTVGKGTPAITLSTPSSTYVSGATVPITVTLPLSSALAAPTGNISVYNGSTLIGSPTLSYSAAAGGYVATVSVSTLPSGSIPLYATFNGNGTDANYNYALSATDTITIETNNVWLANGNGTISGLTNSGTPYTSSAVGTAGTGAGIAIDAAGDVWALNTSANSVVETSKTGALISSGYAVGAINTPRALAFDGAGLLWIANGNNTISVLNSSGAAVSSTAYKSASRAGRRR